MNTFLTHAFSFVGGAIAKWFQGLLQDRKKERQALRDEIFRPMRVEVYKSIPQIESRMRVTTLDFEHWNRVVASGRNREIPDDLCDALEQLYNREMPRHDRAWQDANDQVTDVMGLVDRDFGKPLSRRDLPVRPWWLFLTQETFSPEILGWDSGPPFRLWDRELNMERLRPLHGSIDDLLNRIWTEGQSRPAILAYIDARISCLKCSKECLRLLDAAIGGSLVSRLPKPLRKFPI